MVCPRPSSLRIRADRVEVLPRVDDLRRPVVAPSPVQLQEFLEWRIRNPGRSMNDCMTWTIESVGEMEVEEYSSDLVDRTLLTNQIENEEFDDRQFIWTLDISIIATAFGQFLTEGVIDPDARPALEVALRRQLLHADIVRDDWPHASTYEANLRVLLGVLESLP